MILTIHSHTLTDKSVVKVFVRKQEHEWMGERESRWRETYPDTNSILYISDLWETGLGKVCLDPHCFTSIQYWVRNRDDFQHCSPSPVIRYWNNRNQPWQFSLCLKSIPNEVIPKRSKSSVELWNPIACVTVRCCEEKKNKIMYASVNVPVFFPPQLHTNHQISVDYYKLKWTWNYFLKSCWVIGGMPFMAARENGTSSLRKSSQLNSFSLNK